MPILLQRIARRLLPESARRWLRPPAPPRPSDPASPPTLEEQLSHRRMTFAQWHDGRGPTRLYSRPAEETLAWLQHFMQAEAAATISSADQIREHRFNLLGSGPYQPIDPERFTHADGYQPIDWYLDPIKGLRFPRGVPHKEWNLLAMRPGLADIKLPWELARWQHWPTLAQAYLLTSQPCYAQEIAKQLDDFMEANPVGRGIHWTCTMDVALRALNGALALEMIADAPDLDAGFRRRAYEALFDHGVFIFDNLENHYEVTSNHFLSNLVGLFYLSAVFADLPQGQLWNDFCREGLETEMRVQVLDDGADYESSVPYHRLVTELFLGAARLAKLQGTPLSDDYQARLQRMVVFLAAVLRPDGRLPQIGDADDGRLHIFTGYGRWDPQDARHLFAPAGRFFHEPRWTELAGESGIWEAVWWGYPPEPASLSAEPVHLHAQLFPDAGLAVVRGRQYYLLVSNGIVGTRGFGNHKHNDQLSFEYHLDGAPLIVDPGSYVYTSDPERRNRFRSTASHNTLCIDGVEQNEMRPEWLFRLFESAHAEHLGFRVVGDAVEYRGRHVGYRRLSEPVTHERRFLLRLEPRTLEITDRLIGQGKHTVEWHFHLAPCVEANETRPGVMELRTAGRRYELTLPANLTARISEAAYSPSYGVRVPCRAIDVRTEVELNERMDFAFTIAPM